MRGSWRIGRILGIDITIDASWIVIVGLITYELGLNEFPRALQPLAVGENVYAISIALGIATSLLLFASVLAHELSHSWMAIQRGIRVTRITLFIFGGAAQIADEPDRPLSEFLIAIMGPLMSVALAVVFGAAWLWLQIIEATDVFGLSMMPLILLTGVLFQANGSLALFNLAPGFPLDGGRVVRAILWGTSHDIRRSTRVASRAGQLIALVLIGVGLWSFFRLANGGGIWYMLIGFFLWSAAEQGYRQTILVQTLRGTRVSQVMTPSGEPVSPDLSIAEFVDQRLISGRDQTFAVSDGISHQGIISRDQVKHLPRGGWAARRVRDLMTPIENLETLAPDQNAATALAHLSAADAAELPVIEGGHIVGFVGRAELSRFLQAKSGLERI